ncbi:type IV pilus secretin family protein [Oscillatoria acuminata]|uniref:Type II secretory pathway, component HofQ n=1 Tax=Oscillatoria acuminata PCC 6304 TaxID=56110 RepID=K9THB7_9CYAN|nr:type II secretory pathway, component HofQ [Oscillatoria acuminata PCC 6304]
MKQPHALGCLFGASAIVVMASAPAMAVTQITGVNVNTSGGGVQVILDTQGGDRPQVFTVNRGTDVIADIINTQLNLPGGQSFRQNNPAPGIASIVVTPLDANSVRVIVSGSNSAPEVAINQADSAGINLGFNTGGVAASPNISPSTPPPPPGMTPPPGTTPGPEVLVPNPQITIEGGPAPIARPNQPSAPPFQPRAVAPPVGDIAVSNLPSATPEIDLGAGSTEIIPRLVLRDASVRDVLSLLARTAGLNLAYTPGVAPADGQAQQPGAEVADASPKISLDIENESVQDVFNYIIRLSALEANRVGDTIFVGTRLPDEARNVVVRTLRMNQVSSTDAAGFLTAQGAETQISRERLDIITIGEGAAARTIESRTPEILALRATQGDGPLLLSGLSVLTNERINGITLVGPPNKVEIATSFLSQLDLRRRQVAVNVKIVDVDLLATENFSTSFSFGINDSFFVNDGGAAVANFGGINPPTANTITGSEIVPPVLTNPLSGAGLQFDPNQTTQVPLTGPGAGALFLRPVPGISTNPRDVRVSDYTVFEVDPTTGVITPGTAEFSLPTLFQYPQKFLALLQAQVVSGNAKILTDPTMVVQEGETARLSLTQEIDQPGVFQQVNEDTGVVELFAQPGRIGDAGLTLNVSVSRIDDNGFVTMNIIPSVSAPTGRSTITGGTLLSTRTLQSGTIRIRDGQTLILSGIIQDIDRSFVSKIPILGDLPIIGSLFRSTQRENRRQEVIVLVTPQILDDSDNAGFGYGYAPGQEVQQMLNQNR